MPASKPPKPPAAADPGRGPYDAFDPIPQPDVVEKNSETTWELWHEVREKEHGRYADTVPLTSPGPGMGATRPAAGAPVLPGRPAPQGASGVEQLGQEARRNNRVCPRPAQWQQLHELLRTRAGAAAAASLPPLLPAKDWPRTTSLARRLAFRQLLDWAVAQALVEDALLFLRGLPEEDWHHMGD